MAITSLSTTVGPPRAGGGLPVSFDPLAFVNLSSPRRRGSSLARQWYDVRRNNELIVAEIGRLEEALKDAKHRLDFGKDALATLDQHMACLLYTSDAADE